jgi:hypothetical protein
MMGFTYVVGVTGTVSMQSPAQPPLQAKELAMQLPSRRFRTVKWREGTNRTLSSLDIVNYDVRLHDNYDGRSTGVIVAVNWL